ncbi:MAG: UDP-N-acetylmuramoyl-tripeptide--D-alanyl-D-alanine ligase [Candidatus Omnitrophica bacterium]|nr:UDP-N-acetylmuramoyl-tripeptide--D-alanyl-D-alanine ligase [Candidatus Omnitrophota bacterium]
MVEIKMLTLGQITKACGGTLIAGGEKALIVGVSSDSRTIQRGELFVALRGERFDGHAFLKEADRRGAAAALVEYKNGGRSSVIVVEDTLKALQRLARFYRAQFSIPAVAITGSAGKTTTKECIGAVLSEVFKVKLGFRNWNNHVGVPLNILKLSGEDQCLVLELGANHKGEIARLSEMAQPTVAVITTILPVHLEGFGSLEGIYQAKLEVADYLDRNGGTVIANGDDPKLVERLQGRKFSLITFGTKRSCDYVLSGLVVQDGLIYFRVNDRLEFRIRGQGAFNAMNALAAIATAGYFNLDLESLGEAWQALPKIEGRFHSDHIASRDILLVDDSYNANPKSFECALESFQDLARGRRKVVVVGDMLELGGEGRFYHEALGKMLARDGIDYLIGVGLLSRLVLDTFKALRPEGHVVYCEKAERANPYLLSILQDGDALLIKGSHGMKLEKIRPFLKEHFRTAPVYV